MFNLPSISCFYALCAGMLLCTSCSHDEVPPGRGAAYKRPNIVLITIESLRADHMGYNGYERDTSPHVDALAAQATVFENAFSVTSWTLPTHASIFTGLYPSAHRVVGPSDRLADSYLTLAEVLRDGGYQTSAIVSGPYLTRTHGLHQGFLLHDTTPVTPVGMDAGRDVTNPRIEAAVRRFLEGTRDPNSPFFLFLYYWDPHYHYIPPAPYDGMFVPEDATAIDKLLFDVPVTAAGALERQTIPDDLREALAAENVTLSDRARVYLSRSHDKWRILDGDRMVNVRQERGDLNVYLGNELHFNKNFTLGEHISPSELEYVKAQYDGEIRSTDAQIGALFERLRALGLWENTAVILTSDHGEQFFEHGHLGHKYDLHVESLHVPLLIRRPGQASARRDARLANQVDLFPTVLQIAGLDVPEGQHGVSLLDEVADPGRPHFFELDEIWYTYKGNEMSTETNRWYAVLRGDLKLVWREADGSFELYDRNADPREMNPITAGHEAKIGELLDRLDRWRAAMKAVAARHGVEQPSTLSPEEEARLKSLGYLQ